MADFFTPANILQGRGAAESPGTGPALGDTPLTPFGATIGVDYLPNDTESVIAPVGGINHKSIGVMSSDSTGDSDKEQPVAFLESFQRMGANAGAFRISVQGGAEIVIDQAAYAGPMASGNFYVAASDIGVGPGQIPNDTKLWTEPIMRPHVSVFVRDASHCRGVVSQLDGSATAGQMNALVPSIQVFSCVTVPVYSTWCIVVDGHAQAVLFRHVNGAGDPIDVRRPRDIWAQVVMPQLQKSIAQAAPFDLQRGAGAGTTVNRGFISRLNYVSYARFFEYDGDAKAALVQLYNPA